MMYKSQNSPQLRFKGFVGEWMVKKFSALLKEGRLGGNYENSESNNGIPVIKMGNLGRGEININKVQFLPEGIEFNKEDILKKGDLLFNTRNTLELVGKVSIWRDELPFALYNSNLMRMKFNNEIEPSNVFMNYNFNTKNSTNQLRCFATGTTSVAAIYGKDLKGFNVAFPTLPEQQKIASFLSAVDEKIQQLSRKKELLSQYKKGVMQQLFSGKLRFKDENGNDYADWEEKKLGDVCEIVGGGTPDTNIPEYWGGEIQWFTPTEIKSDFVSNSIRTITELGLQKSSAKKLPIGTILLTTRATIGEVSIAREECSTNQGFQSLIARKGNSNIFIFNWIKQNKNELTSRANGSTFPEISKTAIEKIFLNAPSFPEQQKIANFLSSIDAKIESTSQQINQTQSFKKGLLQQLFV